MQEEMIRDTRREIIRERHRESHRDIPQEGIRATGRMA